ncbi:low molecular weight phosphotyrosine protein phosphatase [Vibrio makurazakiensis]|uniref:low molecular weight protein-tyrosine-phosphatase n=1 Tax=Vibrio makurazakiensis TaxID=2910250 RepID=UPI003D10007C
MKKILVVCMGNICRSPTGEAVLRKKAQELGIKVSVDSAGTIGYHEGNPPDPRSKAAGEARGYSFKGIRSRKVTHHDFEEFDLILAADNANLSDLKSQCPEHLTYKLNLFLSFGSANYEEVPDPYYGEGGGFELVLDLIEESSEAILRQFK